jgi:hypothetical protein
MASIQQIRNYFVVSAVLVTEVEVVTEEAVLAGVRVAELVGGWEATEASVIRLGSKSR